MPAAACKKVNTRKYKVRPSPPYHAADCQGKKMKGSDGKMYVSKPDSKGTYKWILIGSKAASKTMKANGKKYEIIDNGGIPFVAYVKPSAIKVADGRDGFTIFNTKYKKVFIGDNDLRIKHPGVAPKGQDPGNSILIHARTQGPEQYIYVGEVIYSFSPLDGDHIETYYSPLGNNRVPYPYAVGAKYVYFMLDKKAVPVEQINVKEDAYPQFYFSETPMIKRPFKVKMIHKRIETF
jgi:hypothetical protein